MSFNFSMIDMEEAKYENVHREFTVDDRLHFTVKSTS